MSKPLLPVPHRTEAFVGACLPACCQMALAFCGISESQVEIAAQIGHIEGAGTPSRNITRLAASGVEVEWKEEGKVDELQQAIAGGKVPVVFLRTGELPYWDLDTPHAVVVVGIEANTAHVNDPAFEPESIEPENLRRWMASRGVPLGILANFCAERLNLVFMKELV